MKLAKLSILALAATLPAASMLAGSAVGPNLIQDPGFDTGIAGWDNFSGNPQHDNGTLKITNDYQGTGNSYFSGWYCAPVTEGVKYAASTGYFVPADAPAKSGAYFGLHYYASPDCTGGNLVTGGASQSGGRFPEQRGMWLTFSFEEVAPATAKSVRVRATAFKEPNPYNSSIPETHVVWFDNVFFGEATDVVDPEPEPQDPPVNDPPAEEPPAEEPPAEEPPADEPPAEDPPADEPPADDEPPYVPPIVIPTDPEPYDPPQEPTEDPAEPKGDVPAPQTEQPQPETPADDTPPVEPVAEPTTEPVAEVPEPNVDAGVPLPPATGNTLGAATTDANAALTAASIASMLTGLGLFGLLIRKRRQGK